MRRIIMSGLHGEEVVIGGNPSEALKIIDELNKSARKRRIENGVGSTSLNGAAMDPVRGNEVLTITSEPPIRFIADI